MKQLYSKFVTKLNSLSAPDLNLFSRIWIAAVFFKSGRTKVGDGFLTPSDSALYLFEHEYALPFLPYEFAAKMAIYAETFLPILLILGLFTRLSAAALLGMTAVIQFFVYPENWLDHLTWAVVLVFLLLRGAGILSMDKIFLEHSKD